MEVSQTRPTLGERLRDVGEGIDLSLNLPIRITTKDIQWHENTQFERSGIHFVAYPEEIKDKLKILKTAERRGKISVDKARLLRSELRALDYLYGDGAKTSKREISSNPLVDLLTLISGRNEQGTAKRRGHFYQLAIDGPPERKGALESTDEVRRDQYSYEKNKLGQKVEFRTLSRFGSIQRTVAKTLHIFAQVNDRYPEILQPTLEKYARTVSCVEGGEVGMAVGMLELMFNMDLIQDPRFSNLGKSLRDIVLGELGDTEELKKHYFYRVTRYSPFWLEGEKVAQGKRAVLYGKERTNVAEEVAKPIILPEVDQWDVMARNLHTNQQTISKLTMVSSISRVARTTDRSLTAYSSDMRQTMREKAELIELVRSQGKKLPSDLRKMWSGWLKTLSVERKTTSTDSEAMDSAVRTIMRTFVPERTLSRKSAGLVENKEGPYKINPDQLLSDTLFNWIFALRDEDLAAGLEKAVSQQPAEFALLLRLMTYEVSSKYFRKRETKFLFDPQYKEKADPEQMVKIVQSLRDIVNRHRPDIKQIFLEVLATGDKSISDLMEKKRMKRVKKNLRALNYEEPLPLIKIDKSKQMTRREFLSIMVTTGVFIGSWKFGTWLGDLAFGVDEGKKEKSDLLLKNQQQMNIESDQRIPEALSREAIAKLDPFFYGHVLNLPKKYFPGNYGDEIGYFANRWSSPTFPDYFSTAPIKSVFGNVVVVDSLPESVPPDMEYLIVRPEKLTPCVIPPTGWKVAGVIQEKGALPLGGFAGEVYFGRSDTEEPPANAILLFEKIPDLKFDSYLPQSIRLASLTELEAVPDNPPLRLERAHALTERLSNDPELQELHYYFISDMEYYADRTDTNDTRSYLATYYTERFKEYIERKRFYALGFSVEGKYSDSDSSSLEAIANSPDQGFYCEIASRAYREFMDSGGIRVYDQPGFGLKGFNDQMWGRIAHQNNVTILPNHQVMFVDVTPPVTDKTPREDVEALTRSFTDAPVTEQKDKDSALILAAKYGVGSGLTLAAAMSARELGIKVKEKSIREYVDKFLSETRDLSEIEREVLIVTVDELAHAQYDQGFYTQASQTLDKLNRFSPQKHGAVIHWLVDNAAVSLYDNNPEEAFTKIQEYYLKNRDVVGEDIEKSGFALAAVGTSRPIDFDTAFEIARGLEKVREEVLQRKVYERLGLSTGDEQAVVQAQFKAQDILEMIKDRVADDAFRSQHAIRKESSVYYQALYRSLQNLSGV